MIPAKQGVGHVQCPCRESQYVCNVLVGCGASRHPIIPVSYHEFRSDMIFEASTPLLVSSLASGGEVGGDG
jgi:hypothetical protein